MTAENFSGQRTLQRGEAEDSFAILPQDELHEAIAQAADAVVENDGGGHMLRRLYQGRRTTLEAESDREEWKSKSPPSMKPKGGQPFTLTSSLVVVAI
jgi:hypothetical protein